MQGVRNRSVTKAAREAVFLCVSGELGCLNPDFGMAQGSFDSMLLRSAIFVLPRPFALDWAISRRSRQACPWKRTCSFFP